MSEESTLSFRGLCRYIHRLSKASKAGMKAALADCPKRHFPMLEGLLGCIRSMDRTVPFISPILFRSFINRFLPFPARCGRWSRTALWNALPTLPTAARRWCVSRPRDTRPADSARLLLGLLFQCHGPAGAGTAGQMEALRGALMEAILAEKCCAYHQTEGRTKP